MDLENQEVNQVSFCKKYHNNFPFFIGYLYHPHFYFVSLDRLLYQPVKPNQKKENWYRKQN